MNEGVLIPNLQTGHPPLAHVWHVAIGNMYRAPATNNRLVAMVEVAQSMEIVQIPCDRRVRPVNLKRVESLMTTGVARRFKNSERSIGEAAQERTGIINADWFNLARLRVFALFDKRLGHRRDGLNRPIKP